MSKPAVLHVVPYLPPDRLGGVGEVAAHIHRGLLERGHRSAVVTSGISTDDPNVHRIARSPAGFVALSWRAQALVSDFDVIHCHHGEGFALLALSRMRKRLPPTLLTFHVSNAHIGRAFRPYELDGVKHGTDLSSLVTRFVKTPLHLLVDNIATRLATRLSFISESAAEDVAGKRWAERGSVVYNGVPPAESVEPAAPSDILYVGTHGHRKRVRALPDILSRVRARVPGATLRIIGFDLDADATLTRDFESRGLGAAVLAEGRLRSEELDPYYAASKVLVVPSIYEGLPMVILEAARLGLPSVATAVSGHPEVIADGSNGFLVPPDDPGAMAGRAADLIEDADLQHRLGEAARQTVTERFSVTKQVDSYVSLYRETIAEVKR